MKGTVMQHKEKVTVIIPTYSRSDMLSSAVNSALNQTYENVEVIVVDDNGDNDHRINTEKTMEKYSSDIRVRYIQHDANKGGSAARNTGIRNASGRYISFLDDDDIFLPEKLEKQIAKLNSLDDSWGCVYCGCNLMEEGELLKKYLNGAQGNLTKQLLLMETSMFAGSTLLVKKEVIDEVDGFDESFSRHQDWELMLRIFRKYKIAYVNEALVNVYMDSNISRIKNGLGFEKLKEKYLSAFKEDINKYDEKTVSQIYRNHYFHIALGYMSEKKIFKAIKWWDITSRCHRLTKSQRTILLKGIVKLFINPNLVRKFRNKFKITLN